MIPLNAAVRNEDLTMNNRTTSCSGIQGNNRQLLFASVVAASFLVGVIIGAGVGFGIRSSLETGCPSFEMKNPPEGRILDSSDFPKKDLNFREGSSIEKNSPSEGRRNDSSDLPKKVFNFHEVFNMERNCACHVPKNRLVFVNDLNVTLNSWNPRKNSYKEIMPNQLCIPVCDRADSCNTHGEICQDNTTEIRSYQVLVSSSSYFWRGSSNLEWIEVEVPSSCECKKEEKLLPEKVYKSVIPERIWSL